MTTFFFSFGFRLLFLFQFRTYEAFIYSGYVDTSSDFFCRQFSRFFTEKMQYDSVFWADVYIRISWNAKKLHQTKAHNPVSNIAPVAYKLCNITEEGIENIITNDTLDEN